MLSCAERMVIEVSKDVRRGKGGHYPVVHVCHTRNKERQGVAGKLRTASHMKREDAVGWLSGKTIENRSRVSLVRVGRGRAGA